MATQWQAQAGDAPVLRGSSECTAGWRFACRTLLTRSRPLHVLPGSRQASPPIPRPATNIGTIDWSRMAPAEGAAPPAAAAATGAAAAAAAGGLRSASAMAPCCHVGCAACGGQTPRLPQAQPWARQTRGVGTAMR